MSLIQSDQAKLMKAVAVPFGAGLECVNIYDIDLSAGVTAASDIIEVGLLPANGKLTGLEVIGAGVGAITADVGIMSGRWGDVDDTRTLTTTLINDGDINNAQASGSLDTLTDVAATDDNRSIGMTLSADVAAGSASIKVVTRTIQF